MTLAFVCPEVAKWPWRMRTNGRLGRLYREEMPGATFPLRDWLPGFYDRHSRDWLYPVERWFWTRSWA